MTPEQTEQERALFEAYAKQIWFDAGIKRRKEGYQWWQTDVAWSAWLARAAAAQEALAEAQRDADKVCDSYAAENQRLFDERDSARAAAEEAKRDAERMRELGYELDGVIADCEHGNGFDSVCLETLKRVRAALAADNRERGE